MTDLVFPESIAEAQSMERELHRTSPRPTINFFCSCMHNDGRAGEFIERDKRLVQLSYLSHGLYVDYKRKYSKAAQEIAELKEENEELKRDLERRNNTIAGLIGVKNATEEEPEKNAAEKDDEAGREEKTGKIKKKKRGAPKGHRGASRPIPKSIDRTENVSPHSVCPDCRGTVDGTGSFDKVIIEDIVAIVKEVVQRNLEIGKCRCCGKEVRHPHVFGPPVRVGGNASAMLVSMRQTLGVSFGKLAGFSSEYLGIPLTESGAYGIVTRAADKMKAIADSLKLTLREKDWLNVDETGWKKDGERWYMWGFFDDKRAVYHPSPSRSADVPKEILGKNFKGTVIADFYSAYNFLGSTQRCLVHYLRAVCDELKITPHCRFLKKQKKNCKEIIKIGAQFAKDDLTDKDRERKGNRAKELFDEMRRANPPPKNKVCVRLSKRLERFKDSILTFLHVPGIDCHNNRAERQLRPVVLFRKISFGNRTEEGAERYGNTATVIETARLQGYSPFLFMKDLIKPFADISILARKLI